MSNPIPSTPTREILARQGFDGERLLRMAHAVALDAQRRAPGGLGGKYEDLVAFLVLQALESTAKYDANRSGHDFKFSSYLYDIMERRVTDWYRRKSEGFGDRRNGSDDRIVLAGDETDILLEANHDLNPPQDDYNDLGLNELHDELMMRGLPLPQVSDSEGYRKALRRNDERRHRHARRTAIFLQEAMSDWEGYDERSAIRLLKASILSNIDAKSIAIRGVNREVDRLLRDYGMEEAAWPSRPRRGSRSRSSSR